jgi:hypothetical protein
MRCKTAVRQQHAVIAGPYQGTLMMPEHMPKLQGWAPLSINQLRLSLGNTRSCFEHLACHQLPHTPLPHIPHHNTQAPSTVSGTETP